MGKLVIVRRVARVGVLGIGLWVLASACGGGDTSGTGSGSDTSGGDIANCPSGQNGLCFGQTADTCYCGTNCTSASECTTPGYQCLTNVCASLADYCHALFAVNPNNPYVPCEPFQPQIDCAQNTAVANCSAVGVTCSASACCPTSMPYACPNKNLCYATSYDASVDCGTSCIVCN